MGPIEQILDTTIYFSRPSKFLGKLNIECSTIERIPYVDLSHLVEVGA